MKNTLACPKCDSRKLWRIERFRHDSDIAGGRELPVAIFVAEGEGPLGMDLHKRAGRYDAYVCAQCGYSEFWAHGLNELTHRPEDGIHFIDTTPQQGEYR